ncbi:imidazole glycerol phosphate synthase subunit HisH [Andreprevotia chitinilytica]|uniref:imidazole glycerol phosphate synthase subunit HisH n=1 Tax=Andreprevotia chitinilytica TaxID=396808 RepID=UPI0005553D95|nr:imidazole glycerol phosphate synthase subunit HisH [Andreprevotia chitinilytica]
MIYVVDYGVGNIGSVLNMIKKVGGQAKASGDISELSGAEKILLPGVGSFDNAIGKLQNLGLTQFLKDKAASGTPFLGICLGMQLLSDASEEGNLPGLGLIPGKVKRFTFSNENASLKIPHMGWNRVRACQQHPLIEGIDASYRYYFVHSYHFECADQTNALLESSYGYSFTSGVYRGNVMGVQFHPEKSLRFGMRLIENFVRM